MGTSLSFPKPGEEFEGYHVLSVLGSGGFARVYKAWEHLHARPVALKVLLPEGGDSTLVARFEREGEVLARLQSPYTVRMLSRGTALGLHYMALEFIDGKSLAEVREPGQSFEPERVVRIISQVLESLSEAHRLGMLHRDIKPANIMVGQDEDGLDFVTLVDFGIAKASDLPLRKGLTTDGTVLGTPRYMAPEQIHGEGELTPAADIYSLGLVAYELLVGRRAIESEKPMDMISEQLSGISFSLPFDSGVPPALRAVVNRMIEKNQSARFSKADDVLLALKSPDILEREEAGGPSTMQLAAIRVPTQELPPRVEPTPPKSLSSDDIKSALQTSGIRKRSKHRLDSVLRALALFLLVSLGVVLVLIWLRR